MESLTTKNELIEESIQDWLHHEDDDVTLTDCIETNISLMFLNHQHIPNISNDEVAKLEKQYAEQKI